MVGLSNRVNSIVCPYKGTLYKLTNERSRHGAEPGHGAGEGQRHGPDHRREQLRRVQVHDAPAYLHRIPL